MPVSSGMDLFAEGNMSGMAARAVFVAPMLAQLTEPATWRPARPDEWCYERKFDGLRCVAVRTGDNVELYSRNRNSFNARFPAIRAQLLELAVDNFTLDGEVVAYDGVDFEGFGALQQHGRTMDAVFCTFDVLHLMGKDTRKLALTDRKRLLASVVESVDLVLLVEPLVGEPDALLSDACARGWEGLIAKRTAAKYASGRSPDWRKLKCTASQELVIGGWTDPQGARTDFGALLVGYFEGGSLRYAGKVGTGFTTATLRDLGGQLRRRAQDAPPFVDPPREKGAHWVAPELVAAIAFSEWTRDGRLRHPRFEGLRTDKDATSVVRERPTA